MAENTEVTWHKTNKTWKKINEFLFKNETMSDCAFLIKAGNTTVKIPAHKYVLGGYSPEFFNLFYLLKSDSDEIPIDDVSAEDFIKFLEFVYTETTEITMDNVEVLIMLAVRYSVESFKDFCGDFILNSITGENVLLLMDNFLMYNLPNFELECMKIVSKNRLIFEDPQFLDVSNNTLTTILKSEQLMYFKEITIFKGVDKWAEEFCDKNNREISSKNKRLALGEALNYIRFAAMTSEEFSSCTSNVENSVLTTAEMVKVFQFISTNGKTNCSYSGEKRPSEYKICNFVKGIQLTTHIRNIAGFDCLRFTVNKPIQFHGFGMFGRVDSLTIQNPEKFIIQLKMENGAVFLEDILEIEVEIHHDGTDKVYELLFSNAQLLKSNKEYYLNIQRQRPGSFLNYVFDGKDANMTNNTMNVDGIIFKIHNLLVKDFCASLIFKEQ